MLPHVKSSVDFIMHFFFFFWLVISGKTVKLKSLIRLIKSDRRLFLQTRLLMVSYCSTVEVRHFISKCKMDLRRENHQNDCFHGEKSVLKQQYRINFEQFAGWS